MLDDRLGMPDSDELLLRWLRAHGWLDGVKRSRLFGDGIEETTVSLLNTYLSMHQQDLVFSALLTLAIAAIKFILTPRAKVAWGVSHGFSFVVKRDANVQTYHTRTIFLQNIGRKTAESIGVHMGYEPEHFQVWPTHNYTVMKNPENNFAIMFENLGKREWVTVEMLGANAIPDVLRVRTPAGESKLVPIAPAELLPSWKILFFRGVFAFGIFGIIENIFIIVR